MGKKSFALGRGLSDILRDHNISGNPISNSQNQSVESSDSQKIIEIDIELIDPNPFQPRKFFNDDELKELAETIKVHGLIQPIAVRKVNNRYQIISGERRTRASKLANLKTIKAQVYENFDDKTMNEWALIENIQRVDLNPIEVAQSYQQLIENHNYTHEDLATTVGKSRSAITNALRLLKLPNQVQAWIQEGRISSGAARALCSDKVSNPEEIARRIIEEGLNVRQIEAIIRGDKVENQKKDESESNSSTEKKEKVILSADMKHFEEKLETFFGTKVSLNPSNSNESKGTIVINYYSIEDLTRIQEIMENH